MRKSIRDPFFYNTIDRDDFRNAFVRAFTFRYDKYQEDYMDILDAILDACDHHKIIGDFMCYYDGADYFIHNTRNNVIVGWYKHFGRCNCVNIKGFTANDLYQFFKELRMACYKAGYYHIATSEWKAEQEAFAKAEEARRNDPEYQKRQIEKVTRNSIYGVSGGSMIKPIPISKRKSIRRLRQMIKRSNPSLNMTDLTSMYPEVFAPSLLDPKTLQKILKARKEAKTDVQHS